MIVCNQVKCWSEDIRGNITTWTDFLPSPALESFHAKYYIPRGGFAIVASWKIKQLPPVVESFEDNPNWPWPANL